MRTYSEADIRDVALIGHGGAGKTSLGEAILFDTKAVTRLGRVDEESSNLDTEPEEKKRKGTINPHVATVEWQKSKINFIDTSGQGDFLVDTLVAIGAADSAVCVVSASDGVQVYTEKTWEEANERGLPRLIFINKMDRAGANPFRVKDMLRDKLGHNAWLVNYPIGAEDQFKGCVDLLTLKAHYFDGDNGENIRIEECPPELLDKCKEARHDLVGALADFDDALAEKFLEEKESDEICKELEISASNYWVILHRAKLQLRKCLEKNWFAA